MSSLPRHCDNDHLSCLEVSIVLLLTTSFLCSTKPPELAGNTFTATLDPGYVQVLDVQLGLSFSPAADPGANTFVTITKKLGFALSKVATMNSGHEPTSRDT